MLFVVVVVDVCLSMKIMEDEWGWVMGGNNEKLTKKGGRLFAEQPWLVR